MKQIKTATLLISLLCLFNLALHAQQYDARSSITDTQTGTATYYADVMEGIATASGEPYRMEAFTAAHTFYPMGAMLRVTNLDRNLMIEVRVNDRIPAQGDRILNLSKAAAYQLGMLTAGRARVRVERISGSTAPAYSGNYATNNPNTSAVTTNSGISSSLAARSPYASQAPQQPAKGWTPQQQKIYNPKENGAPDWAAQLFKEEKYPAPRNQGNAAITTPSSSYPTPAQYNQPNLTARGYTPSPATAYSTGQSLPANTNGYAIQLGSYGEIDNAQSHVNQLLHKGFTNAYLWQKDGKNRVVLGDFPDRASALNYLSGLRQQYMDGIVVQLR